MKNLLFPKAFRVVGWTLFIPAIIIGILTNTNVITPSGITETIINDAIIIGIAIGAIFIVCSKEASEDEMTRSIRLASLLNALYVYVILLIASTIFINGIAFLHFMMVNLVLFPIVFVIIFSLEMHRYNKICQDEE